MDLDRVDRLFDRCLDGVAERAEYERLDSLLRHDPAARSDYLRLCEVRQALADEGALPVSTLSEKVKRPRAPYAVPLAGTLAALAASLVVAVGLWRAAPDAREASRGAVEAAAKTSASHDVIATIEQKINCVWSDEAWSLDNPSSVTAGRTISLERGFMRLALRNGVIVVLEGPVEFTPISETRGALNYGGIGVRVPEGFNGYVVDTPSAKVTDLGTEFSLRVSDDGVTDLSVIDGEVEVTAMQRDDSGERLHTVVLEKDEEWSSLSGLKAPQGAPSPTDFPTATLLEDPTPDWRPDLPVTDELALWLAADTAVKTDRYGRVLAWGDISSEATLDRHSAWQVESERRPRFRPDEGQGAASIVFDGVDDCLITEPFATGESQTVALVARLESVARVPGAVRGPQFINYNGPPNLVVEYDYVTEAVRGRVFAGYGRLPRVSGQTKVGPVLENEALVIVYSYDHANNRALLFLNGESGEPSPALVSCASDRPKVIGLHCRLLDSGLPGSISELMIYDRAIDRTEIEELHGYFDRRYDSVVWR